MTTYLSFCLHAYQPPWQEIEILKRIDKECYKPLFSVIQEHENAKFNLNINGILIELLYQYGLDDTIKTLKNLVAQEKVEILGTGKYHPILPLIPEKELQRQIRLNEETNAKEFGNYWQKKGFFPPEMAISPKLAKYVREAGYKWIIASGIACPVEEKGVSWPYDIIYSTPNGLLVYFRDDILSNKISFKSISPEEFIESISGMFKDEPQNGNNDNNNNNKISKDKYVIIAQDAETYGHHIRNYEKDFLGKTLDLIADEEDIKMISISELDKHFVISEKKIIPKASSWSTTHEDLIAKVPFPLWKHPDNNVHKYYWKMLRSLNNLIDIADNLDLTENWDVENYYNTARWLYDRGLHSCPLWWSNAGRGMWSPNLIYKGVEMLMRAALNAQLSLVYAGRDEGEGYFDSISYYHGLLLMELYAITKKSINRQ